MGAEGEGRCPRGDHHWGHPSHSHDATRKGQLQGARNCGIVLQGQTKRLKLFPWSQFLSPYLPGALFPYFHGNHSFSPYLPGPLFSWYTYGTPMVRALCFPRDSQRLNQAMRQGLHVPDLPWVWKAHVSKEAGCPSPALAKSRRPSSPTNEAYRRRPTRRLWASACRSHITRKSARC